MPGGDKCILREETGLENVIGTVVVPFDTTVVQDQIYSVSAGRDQVTVSETGHYLVAYNFGVADISPGSTTRMEINAAIRINGTPQPFGRAARYLRGTATSLQNDDRMFVSGSAILSLTAGDVVSIEAVRTDNQLTVAVRLPASVSGSGLQIIKLNDDWPYLRLSRTAAASAATRTFQGFEWTGQQEVDAAGFAHSTSTNPEQVRLVGATSAARYLVCYNVAARYTSGTRIAASARLLLDDGTGGVEIEGSWLTGYAFSGQSCLDGGISFIGLVTGLDPQTGTGNVLELEYRSENSGVFTPPADRSSLSVVRLPDDAGGVDYLRLTEAGGGQAADDAQDISFDTQEILDSSYTHTLGAATVTVGSEAWYLFLAQILSERNITAATNARIKHHFEWYVNGTLQSLGGFGGYSRGLAVPIAPYSGSSGALTKKLQALDGIKLRHVNEATGTDPTATFPAGKISLQAINLDQLMPRLKVQVQEVVEIFEEVGTLRNFRRMVSRAGQIRGNEVVGELSQHALQRGQIANG